MSASRDCYLEPLTVVPAASTATTRFFLGNAISIPIHNKDIGVRNTITIVDLLWTSFLHKLRLREVIPMRITLRYENGLRVEAVLVATSDYRMRIVVRGESDATELRLIKEQWMSEEGDAVDIESLITAGEIFPQPVTWGCAA